MFPRSVLKTSTPNSQYVCSFSHVALREFHSIGVTCHYDAHETLLREGFPAEHLLIICSGRVVTAASTEGRLLLPRAAGPGDILGLAALQEHTLHRVTAETLAPCTIKSIPRAEFVRFMETPRRWPHHRAGPCTRLQQCRPHRPAPRAAHLRCRQTRQHPSLDLARVDESDCAPAHTNLLSPSSCSLPTRTLGSMAGLSRETVSRLLTRFRREGHVLQIQDRMTLNHPIQMEARYC